MSEPSVELTVADLHGVLIAYRDSPLLVSKIEDAISLLQSQQQTIAKLRERLERECRDILRD